MLHRCLAGNEHQAQKTAQLSPVFETYFILQQALVKSDANQAAKAAAELAKATDKVVMGNLGQAEHQVWMQVKDKIAADVRAIGGSTDIKRQRVCKAKRPLHPNLSKRFLK